MSNVVALTLATQTFKNPKPALLAALRETGPVPGEENGRKKGDESAKKKKRGDKGVCTSSGIGPLGVLT